ncbi:terpenoid cyclases/Protein prenyltransferase, partial [Cantharellus anzutake]|uniref:terpenoid cyclases/Protein prenyltransferase n=1 Tax=Cantharellus anzutake TaxID=1750568 RepID=UPI0019083826
MEGEPKASPTDRFPTATSKVQEETEKLIRTLFETAKPQRYTLNRNAHLNFVARFVFQGFPRRYMSQDASQPWLLFWTFQSFQTLGVKFDDGNRTRAVSTVLRYQHPQGGFCGGPGQNAHLLANYAAVCSIAIMGFAGPNGGWDQIDRVKMYEWLMSLKQPDGSFLVSAHAEVDVRGIYCLLVVATLLDIMTPELVEGLDTFLASCQTYEGGFSAASQPYFSASDADTKPNGETLLTYPRPPLGEAHGGYTYCALAALALLEPIKMAETPHQPLRSTTRWMGLNIKRLYRWAASLQGAEVEGGGFRGRTNKLVDGCYSWWVGGLFPILDDIMGEPLMSRDAAGRDTTVDEHGEDEWADDDIESLFNRQALQRFILISSQADTGGLRDKPSKPADAYHTLYNLSGLSAAQHRLHRPPQERERVAKAWKSSWSLPIIKPNGNAVERFPDEVRREIFVTSTSWVEDEPASRYVGGKVNRVNATHPVFDLTMTTTKAFMDHFYAQGI